MSTLTGLLSTLGGGGDATRPRLVHYDPQGRIELSGRVLVNWVAKAANLLTEEFDAAPGTVVGLRLPPGHWRAAYWALATWSCGATLRCLPAGPADAADAADAAGATQADETRTDGLDVLVTDTPPAPGGGVPVDVVAITTAALARRFPGDLPDGALDEAAVLATYADVFAALDEPAGTDPAIDGGVAFADLVPPASGDAAPRVLLADPGSQQDFLLAALAAWAADGTVVVVTGDGADGPALERIAEQEGVSTRA